MKSFTIILMLVLYLSLFSAHAGHQWLNESLLHCPSKLQHFPLKQEKKKTSQKSVKMSQEAWFLLWPSLSVFPWQQSAQLKESRQQNTDWAPRSKLLQTHLRLNRWMLSYTSAIAKQLWAKVDSWASFALFPQGQPLSRFNECVSCVLTIYLQHLSCQNLTWSFLKFYHFSCLYF